MSLSKNLELSDPSFPDLIWESSVFKDFWIVRSSRTMTEWKLLDKLIWLDFRSKITGNLDETEVESGVSVLNFTITLKSDIVLNIKRDSLFCFGNELHPFSGIFWIDNDKSISFILDTNLRYISTMKKPSKKKKLKPRLPIEAVLKLRSHPITTKKGEKGYDRKRIKQQTEEIMKKEILEEKD